jgi:hypothetical protein
MLSDKHEKIQFMSGSGALFWNAPAVKQKFRTKQLESVHKSGCKATVLGKENLAFSLQAEGFGDLFHLIGFLA